MTHAVVSSVCSRCHTRLAIVALFRGQNPLSYTSIYAVVLYMLDYQSLHRLKSNIPSEFPFNRPLFEPFLSTINAARLVELTYYASWLVITAC